MVMMSCLSSEVLRNYLAWLINSKVFVMHSSPVPWNSLFAFLLVKPLKNTADNVKINVKYPVYICSPLYIYMHTHTYKPNSEVGMFQNCKLKVNAVKSYKQHISEYSRTEKQFFECRIALQFVWIANSLLCRLIQCSQHFFQNCRPI